MSNLEYFSISCLWNGKQFCMNHSIKKDLIGRIVKMFKYYVFVNIVETKKLKVMSYKNDVIINVMFLSNIL